VSAGVYCALEISFPRLGVDFLDGGAIVVIVGGTYERPARRPVQDH